MVNVGLRTYGGKAANIEGTSARQVILATVLKGLLQYTEGCKTAPSLINSPFLSKEMGIETTIDDKVSTHDGRYVGTIPCMKDLLALNLFS